MGRREGSGKGMVCKEGQQQEVTYRSVDGVDSAVGFCTGGGRRIRDHAVGIRGNTTTTTNMGRDIGGGEGCDLRRKKNHERRLSNAPKWKVSKLCGWRENRVRKMKGFW